MTLCIDVSRCSKPFLLLQRYVSDSYAKVESNRLNYLRKEQPKLHADKYKHAEAAIMTTLHGEDIGKNFCLALLFCWRGEELKLEATVSSQFAIFDKPVIPKKWLPCCAVAISCLHYYSLSQ